MLLNSLRWTQLIVAVAMTVALGLGLLFPGAMGILALPLGFLYVLWAVRTFFDGRLSIWLACVSTLVVALSLGVFGVTRVFYAFQTREVNSSIALAENGDVDILDELPNEALSEVQPRQESIDRREMLEATLILLLATGAWAVVLMHALEWRWMVSGNRFRTH